MSEPLIPVLTNVGLAAIANAQGTGLAAVIDRIAIGRGVIDGLGVYRGYIPPKTATALRGEMARIPILQGQRRDPSGFSILGVLPKESAGTYPVNEVGFFLENGTLLAVWSIPDYPLAYKTTLADLELGFDLLLEAIPTSALNITVLNPDVPDYAGAIAEGIAMHARLFIEQSRINRRLDAAKI